MRQFDARAAYANLTQGIRRQTYTIPGKLPSEQFRGVAIFPKIEPRFQIARGEKIFTIGSCFARNIEAVLADNGMEVPVAGFALPKGEIDLPDNHILNEYNAGTILQRIETIAGDFTLSDEMGIEETSKGFLDLFLHIHAKPVSLTRLLERRKEIEALYRHILTSETIIITLGLIECWFDTTMNCYLNKAPSKTLALSDPNRFKFRRLDLADVLTRMERGIELLNTVGKKNIILTVSPVPIEATFTDQHAVISNAYSKAVLRCACEALASKFGNVDYFPSYEIVSSAGTAGFVEDNIHVRPDLVKDVTTYMLEKYSNISILGADHDDRPIMEQYISALDDLHGHNDRDNALHQAEYMVRTHTDEWQGYDVLGHVYEAYGDLESAIHFTKIASQKAVDHWGLLVRLGDLYERTNNLTDAEISLRRAVDMANGEADIHFSLFQQRHKPQDVPV